ncbi:MAG: C40 family peptidase [Bacteroidales bacterium]|nr:C40 family peptidase [Bacteroidales bacterium]
MKHSICHYGFIPVRTEPRESAELCTQILFGETYEVLEQQGRWLRVSLDLDGYQGWIDAKLDWNDDEQEVLRWSRAKKWIVPWPSVKVVCKGEPHSTLLSAGSEIWVNGNELASFHIGTSEYHLDCDYLLNATPGIEAVAMSLFGAPYLWGGRSFYGIDCSGFTQLVYKIVGRNIPRDASQQIAIGTTLAPGEEPQLGDLAFFNSPAGNITHVGLCLGDRRIIHASGNVRIDWLDEKGIFSDQVNAYTHTLTTIKRL